MLHTPTPYMAVLSALIHRHGASICMDMERCDRPWDVSVGVQPSDIASCESWVEALGHYTPCNRSSGPFWRRIFQHFCVHRGDATRTVDVFSSRFRTIRLDVERFETMHTVMENAGGDLGEDDIIQVAFINFKHGYNHEFKHVSAWQIIFFFILLMFNFRFYLSYVFFLFFFCFFF
ncbi:hypothetical protein HanRHA438_Chr15g0710041 [Helianthus annuus]|nr:hypothetical protein HanRHA438_Chr15g0710041 [Helianthus annuus]